MMQEKGSSSSANETSQAFSSSSAPKSFKIHHRRTCPISSEDCESSVTMKVRCRRGQLVALLQVLAVLSVLMNVYLVYRLTQPQPLDSLGEGEKRSMQKSKLLELVHERHGDARKPHALRIAASARKDNTGSSSDSRLNNYNIKVQSPARRVSSAASNNQKKSRVLKSSGRRQKQVQKRQRQPQKSSRKKKLSQPVDDVPPREESLAKNATFSACLLIKDDNEILSEWIAYHYHTLRMRDLVVAVDPLSYESPSRILQKWRLMSDLDVVEWTDELYMPDDFLKTGRPPKEYMQKASDFKYNMTDEALLEISVHRYRQRVFLAQCMKTLRKKEKSWVIHIDTDEYVVPSKLLRQMTPNYLTIPPMDEPGSVLNLLQQAVSKTGGLLRYPCISMLRVLFGSVESEPNEVNMLVPEGYNATRFETFRWRYHARPHNRTAHGNPKVVLDVAAVPEEYFEDVVYSIHRPVEAFCQKNKELAFTNFRRQPVAVNHYLGSWERYNGRNDKRRSRSVYNQKAFVQEGKDDGVRGWLSGLEQDMGRETVARLLGEDYLLSEDEEANNAVVAAAAESRPDAVVAAAAEE